MRRRRPPLRITASLLPLTAAAVVTTVLLGTSAPAQVFEAQGSSGVGAARGRSQFGIRVGSATGLRPGGGVAVPVRYANPFSHALVVRTQDIQVSSPSSTCPSSAYVDLSLARSVLAKPVVVPARDSRTVNVVLSMRATAPDECQGVRFTTTVRAEGRKP